MSEPTIKNYLEFAEAIVKITCRDYKAVAKKLYRTREKRQYNKCETLLIELNYLERCIRSDWFCELGVENADYYIEQLNKEIRKELGLD